jgi:peptidoglycan/LPS O-acetylase OafA/YrhL
MLYLKVMDKNNSHGTSHIIGIDGLRAIAILAVMVYHLRHRFLPGGFTGVDVFFVISGYVISQSLASSGRSSFREFILNFYKRRVLRILPALLFCLIIVSIFSTLFIPYEWLSALNEGTARSAFLGISNFFLVHTADGYFSARLLFNPFIHTWSLAVEEQFYLIFPAIFYVWLQARNNNRLHFPSLCLLPVLALTSLVLAAYLSSSSREHIFYLLHGRFWELAAGAMLFQLQTFPEIKIKARQTSAWLLLAGALMIGIGYVYTNEQYFPFPWALLTVLGTALMIAGTVHADKGQRGIQTLINSRIMVYIGKISYSLYLWHWPVFTLFRWTAGLSTPLTAGLAILLTFALAALSYHGIENYFRQDSFIRSQPDGKIITAGLGLIAVSFLSVSLLFQLSPTLKLNQSVTSNRYDWSPAYEPPPGDLSTTHTTDQQRHIFVIGDSHAKNYETMVKTAAAYLGAKTELRPQSGCPIADLLFPAENDQTCRELEQQAIDWIKQRSNPGDIVFLASFRLFRFASQEGSFDQEKVLSSSTLPAKIKQREAALQQTIKLVEEFKGLGLHVLINAPMPIFRSSPFRCSDWFNRSNPLCKPGFLMDRALLLKHREPTMASLKILHEAYGVHIWDPFPILCPGPVCSAFDNGKPVFVDDNHLSGYGNRLLVPSFTNALRKIWKMNSPHP